MVDDKAAGTPSPPVTDMEAATQVRQTMVIAAVGLMPTGGGGDDNFAGATSVNGSKRRRQLTAAQLTKAQPLSADRHIRLEVQCDAPAQLL